MLAHSIFLSLNESKEKNLKAWTIDKKTDLSSDEQPLSLVDLPKPKAGKGELLIKVKMCGICHTEIDEIEGRTAPPDYPVVPGHQAVGVIEQHHGHRKDIRPGDRVGIGWIYSACGKCEYCQTGNENLCARFLATGRDRDGGYAEFMVIPENYAYAIPDKISDEAAAPLLCAGAIGYRSIELCKLNNGDNIGLTGFGASAHLVLKMMQHKYPASRVYVFARNPSEREFAKELGAIWAGDTDEKPPELLNAIIDTTPVWKPVVKALESLRPGGRLVINAIRKESVDMDVLQLLSYERHLWMEKEIKSVANVASGDIRSMLKLAAEIPLKPEVTMYAFERANNALMDIKQQKIRGGKVLKVH